MVLQRHPNRRSVSEEMAVPNEYQLGPVARAGAGAAISCDVFCRDQRWYRWWDFGNGTMSDLGSHDNDVPFTVLDLWRPDAQGGKGAGPDLGRGDIAERPEGAQRTRARDVDGDVPLRRQLEISPR
jgi:hypothetical protein